MTAVPGASSLSPTVEFQAPPSTDSSLPNTAATDRDPAEENKHFSIDLTLELERQLDLEGSPPPTPSLPATSQPPHESLDPHILAHIITGLRKTVDDITKERDDLLKLLEAATTREASLQDTLQLMTEKATSYEEELTTAKKKMKEDEDAITLLRNKVEESRRGLMRLQTESRRQSAAPPSALDLSRAGISGFGNPPPSSKRASFTPLTGRANGHRRISSISVDGQGLGVLHQPDLNPSPNGQFTFHDANANLGPPSSRRSLFKSSPPLQDIPLPPTNVPSPEKEALKKEIESLKRELSDTRMELVEANEAKEASETCVKALRDFIATTQVGASESDELSSIKLPPPPTMTNGEESDFDKKLAPSNSGWGFKLWKADSAQKSSPINTAVPSSPPSASSSPPTQQTPTASAPFSRLGSFFSSRASATSSSSSCNQANAVHPRSNSYRDSMSAQSISVSDASSVIEPLSPANENQGNVRVTIVPDSGDDGVDGTLGASVAKEQSAATHAQQSATVIG